MNDRSKIYDIATRFCLNFQFTYIGSNSEKYMTFKIINDVKYIVNARKHLLKTLTPSLID